MGSFTTSGTYGSHWHGDVTESLNWSNAANNQSSVHVSLVMRADSGYSQVANTSYDVRVNGGVINSGSRSVSLNGNSTELIYGDITVTHDANGNWSGSYGGGLSSSYSGVGSGSGDWAFSLQRLALAPTVSSTTSSNITTNSATVAGAVSSNGHGTSTTITYFYRLSGVGSYTNAGTGASINLTSLSPGKDYQWYITATNNNGDIATSGVQTFTTKSGVKVILPNGTVEDRVVKQILPTGVVSERVVTKVS